MDVGVREAGREEARLISLLPPIHIAVVSRERILSGLDELLDLLPAPAEQSSSMVLITGPSRTADIEQILDILINSKCENHADWKFRFKENSEKMRTGSLLDVAYVLKSLLVLNQTKALSFREKKMLERARYLLVSEMAMARNVDETEMEGLLNRALSKVKLKFPEVTADA